MVQDSAGFQSQQFVEQVEQRRDRYSQQNIDTARNTWGQVGDLPGKFMQARGVALEQQRMQQEQQMRLSQVANDLANDQLHRQQAQEDLLWSQQLHQADMIGLQKRGMAAEIALKEAQTKKAIDELGGEKIPYAMLTPERMDYAIAKLGIMANPSDNMRVRPATDEERAAADQRIQERAYQGQQYELEQIFARNLGRGKSDALETQRDISATGKRLEQLTEAIADKEAMARNSRTDPAEKAMIEQELIALRRTAKQLGDKMDQALLGDERASDAQSEQTGADFIRNSVRGFLNDLDGDK